MKGSMGHVMYRVSERQQLLWGQVGDMGWRSSATSVLGTPSQPPLLASASQQPLLHAIQTPTRSTSCLS